MAKTPAEVVLGLSMSGTWADHIADMTKKIENRVWKPKNYSGAWILITNNAKHHLWPKHGVCLVKIGAIVSPADALRLIPSQSHCIDISPRNNCWIISEIIPLPAPVYVPGGGGLGLWNLNTEKRKCAWEYVQKFLATNPIPTNYEIPVEVLVADVRLNTKKRKRPAM